MNPNNEATPGPDRPSRRGRRLPTGLLGMLALVSGGEWALGDRQADLATVWADDWRRTAEAASREVRGRDLLCFGDSLVKFGVLPRVVEATTGLRGYNLAVNAGTVPSQYFLLRRALEAGARPRVIVADFCPLMLPDDPRGSVRNYPELVTVRDLVDLGRVTRDPDLVALILLGRVFPSLRCRHEIRDDLATLLTGRPAGPNPGRAVRVARGVWRKHLGAQPMRRAIVPPPIDLGLLAGLTPPTWAVDAINARFVDLFLDLTDRHAIPVVWVIPPLDPAIEDGRRARGTAAAYARFARSAQARHPRLVVVDARGSGYDAASHCDALHLSDHGARVFSEDLARIVIRRLTDGPGPPWVDLPPPGPRAIAAGSSEGSRPAR